MPKITERLPQGRHLMGERANLADTVALLAGVNVGSVIKVLAALEAVRKVAKVAPAERIERFADTPTTPPRFDGTDSERVRATRELAERVAKDERVQHLDPILHMRGRVA